MPLETEPHVTAVCGKAFSGKTTFAFRLLLNERFACRFLFDDMGQAARRLKVPVATTARELEAAVPSRWVIFSPHRMFPGRYADACKFFCQWAYDVSGRGEGKKVILLDEVWRWCSPYAIPQELSNIVQAGRHHGLDSLFCTQRPERLNGAILGQITELVCFTLQNEAALDKIEELGADRERIAAQEKGSFVSYNLDNGNELAGKMW